MRTLPGKFVTGKTGDAESYLNPFDMYHFFQQSSKAPMFVLPFSYGRKEYIEVGLNAKSWKTSYLKQT